MSDVAVAESALLMTFSVFALSIIGVAFFAAGTVKGVIGAGLPMVSVPIIALFVEPALAIALTILPVVASNVWQALQGGHYREVFRRFWPFLACLVAGVIGGAQLLAAVDPRLASLVLGCVVLAICAAHFAAGGLSVPARIQPWLNPIAGAVCGWFGGVAGMLAPSILYSAALRLPKDMLVGYLALIALCGTTPLYISLAVNGVLAWRELLLSSLCLVPVGLGMVLGKHIRDRISQRGFERVLFTALTLIALNLIRKGLF